jgi:membrane protein implicated in regulation of membrane protease activity
MTQPQPSRREILKPIELLVFAAVAGIFAGLIVLMSTRDMTLALIFFGIAFIVTLVGIAMFALSVKPSDLEKKDIHEQDSGH